MLRGLAASVVASDEGGMRSWRKAVAVHRWGWFVGCSLLLVACSSTGTGASSSSPRTSVIAPTKSVPFNPAHNVRSDVEVGSCVLKSGQWVLSGTVKSSEPGTKTFQLVIDFVTVPGSTVLSSTVVTLPMVEKGATVHWSATGARGKTHVACLLRQAQAS